MSNEDFARNPKTPPEALAMLSTSPSAAVRLLVAQNPNTPKVALRFLAQDEDKAVREAVAQNPMTPYDAFAAKEAAPSPVAVQEREPPEQLASPPLAPTVPVTVDINLTQDNLGEEESRPAYPPHPFSGTPIKHAEAVSQSHTHTSLSLPSNPSLWQRFLVFLGLYRG